MSVNGNFRFLTQIYSLENNPKNIYNKYKAGTGGVGASSISNRRAKNRLASICDDGTNNCYAFYNTLGKYKANKNPDEVMILTGPSLGLNLTSNPSSNSNPHVPSIPILISLTPTDEHLILNFNLGSNGGSVITDIEYSTDNGVNWYSSGTTSSPFAIIGLTNGVSYPVSIRSINAIGTGEPSNTISGVPNPVINTYSSVGPTSWTAPAGVTSVEYLVVGGGGGSGGGYDNAGGGGGGGGMALTGLLSVTPGTAYAITVGDGGEGGISDRDKPIYDPVTGITTTVVYQINGYPGQNSVFGSIEALGGGGGYASRYNSGTSSAGGSKVLVSTASIGGSGGAGGNGGGGGGGNTTNGKDASGTTGGDGGEGITYSISGTSVTYGAGGRGANSGIVNAAVPGANNTGNGAKAGGALSGTEQDGAKGGSGIVIIRY